MLSHLFTYNIVYNYEKTCCFHICNLRKLHVRKPMKIILKSLFQEMGAAVVVLNQAGNGNVIIK